MPDPPPRAPTFPAFVDQVREIDDSEFVDSSECKTNPTPSSFVEMDSALPPKSKTPPFGDASSTSVPDAVPVVPLPTAQRKSRVRAVLLWRNPKLSALVFGTDMIFFYLTLARGSSPLSVIGALFAAYLILRFIAVKVNKAMKGKFDKYLARPPSGTPLFKREAFIRVADTFVEEGNELSAELRNIIYCDNTPVTFAWISFAGFIYVAGKYFSLLSVFFVGTLAAFSLPLAYEKNKKLVDHTVAKLSDAASQQIETGRRAACDRAVQLRDIAAEKSAPMLDKAPPVAKKWADSIGLTPKKKSQ